MLTQWKLKKNSHNWLGSLNPQTFLGPWTLLSRLLSRLLMQLETIIDSCSKMRRLHALNQPNQQAALVQLVKSRANQDRRLATSIHHFTYNNSHPDNTREIAGAFGRLFASSLTTDSNLQTSCVSCLSLEKFSIVSFLPKEIIPLVGKKWAITQDQKCYFQPL